MTNFILGGASRSGKSSVSRALREKLELNWYPIDPIINSFEAVYPQAGITHTRASDEEISLKFSPFLWKLLKDLGEYYERSGYGPVAKTGGYLVDTCYILPSDTAAQAGSHVKTAFFGYPRISAEKKFSQIREHEAEDDWTKPMTDSSLMEHVIRWVNDSKFYERECARHKLKFFDTSFEFDAVVNDELVWLSKDEG